MFYFRFLLTLLCLCAGVGSYAVELYLRGDFGGSSWPILPDYKFSEISDGNYRLVVPADVPGKWKIADADWSGDYNFGKGDAPKLNSRFSLGKGSQDNIVFDLKKDDILTLTIENGAVFLTITRETGGEPVDPENPSADCVVYYDNSSSNWQDVYIHYWNNSGGTAWPGVKMTQYSGSVYTYTVPAGMTGCIFNNGNGTQTGNLTVAAGHVYNQSGDQGMYSDEPVVSGMQPTGTLPVLYITTDNIMMSKDLADKTYRAGSYYLVDALHPENNLGSEEAPLTLQIKARGNYTRTGFAKKPFKLKLDGKQAMMGLTKSKHFALLAHADDDLGYMKNFVGFWLGQQVFPEGVFTPREVPVEVMINGDYRGLYFLTESIRVGDGRIPVESLDDDVSDPALISGGYVVELDNYAEEGQIVMTDKSNGSTLMITPDTPEVYSDVQRRFVTEQFSVMNDFVGEKSDELWKYMDLDMAARYYLVMEILNHWEAYHGSTYMYRDRGEGQKWMFGPLWDMGNAFSDEGPNWIYEIGRNHFGNNWITGMRQMPTFNAKVVETWKWFWGNKVSELEQATKDYAALIEAAAERDHDRWGDAELPVQYNDPLNGYYPTNPTPVYDNSKMEARRQTVWNRLENKINWLQGKWGAPVQGMAEPEWNTYESAPLPDYATEGYVVPPVTSEVKPTGTLPVLYIHTDEIMMSKDLQDKTYRDGTYYLVDEANPENNLGSVAEPLPLQIKARGNYTRTGFAKKPFKLKLGSKQAMMGMTKSKHFALLAHADDDLGYMRNFVGFWLGQQVFPDDVFTPREVPVEVVINGDYRGLYFLTESIRVGDGRIKIAELDDNVEDPTLVSGGYVVELDNYADEGQIVMDDKGGNKYGSKLMITPDTPEVYSPIQRRFVTDQFTMMNDLIGSKDDELWKYMDLDMAARYYLVMEILNHWEAYHGSTYMYRDRGEGHKWMFGPLWDMGHAMDTDVNPNWIYEIGKADNHYGNNWITGLRQMPTFNAKVVETWKWFWGNKVSELEQATKDYAALIEAAAERDHDRWGAAELPVQYNDPLNGNYPTNPTSVYNNSDMVGLRQSAWNRLQAKINWLQGQWGAPVPGMEEPAWNTYESAPLPDYADPNFEVVNYTIYLKAPGKSEVKVWIWNEQSQNIASDWNHRPSMELKIDKDGEEYFVYSFTNLDLSDPKNIIFTWGSGDNNNRAQCSFENGALYDVSGNITEHNWEPGEYVAPELPVIYLRNDAEWANVYIYIYKDDNGNVINNHAWPGEQMTWNPELVYGEHTGFYTYAVPENLWNSKVIFNDGNSGEGHQYPPREDADYIFGNSDCMCSNKVLLNEPVTPTIPYSGTLPVLYINHVSDHDQLFVDKTKVTASFYFDAMDVEGAVSVGSKEDDATYGEETSVALKCELKGRGSSSWTDWDKKPFKLTLGSKAQFFTGIPKSKHYVLLPWCSDAELAFLRNVAGHALARELGLAWTPTEEPIELVIDGEYQGLYFLVESIRPSENRVNILDIGDFDSAEGGIPENWHNWIVELDQSADDADVKYTMEHVAGGMTTELKYVPDIDLGPDGDMKKAKYDAVRDQYIADFGNEMDEFARLVNLASANAYSNEWTGIIDCSEFARYVLVNELMDDPRAFQTACYMYKGSHDANGQPLEDTRWKFGPVWDFSGAFCQGSNKTAMTFLHEDYKSEIPLLEAMWSNLVFRNQMAIEYLTYINPSPAEGPRRAASASSRIDNVSAAVRTAAGKIDGALESDAARWSESANYQGVNATTAAEQAEKVVSYLQGNKDYLDTVLTNGIITGVGVVESDAQAPAEYFDTQGRRVESPVSGGIYIVKRGTKASLQIVR